MNSFYLDTSALVKYYIAETGSDWIRALLRVQKVRVFTSLLTSIEATCTFARRQREGTLSPDDSAHILSIFDYHFAYRYTVVDVTTGVMSAARSLANRHPLRAYDAVQLASACLIHQDLRENNAPPLTFVCADENLLLAAQAEGLLVENPNEHS